MKSIFSWLFPNICIRCRKNSDNGLFCVECFKKCTFIENPYCCNCGKLFDEGIINKAVCNNCYQKKNRFNSARSLFLYDCNIRKMILTIKQTGDRSLVSRFCKMIIAKYSQLFKNTEAIIPVPSYWLRTLIRGFNPPDVIAWELSKLAEIPVIRGLKRIKNTKYQHKKSAIERIENVRGAFKWVGPSIKNALLVDDVMTTGATLNECSKVLQNAGIEKINCVTIASTKAS